VKSIKIRVLRFIYSTSPIQIEHIELEAMYSRRTFTLAWQELTNESQWLQGWQ